MTEKETKTTADNLIERFEAGEDISDYFDFENGTIVYPDSKEAISGVISDGSFETRRVNVDFPGWVVDALDKEARRIGVGRQTIIKTWIVQHLDEIGVRPV